MDNLAQAKERLAVVQQKLVDRGVVDVKFHLALDAYQRPLDEVANELADVLDAYLEGNHKPFLGLGDSVRSPITLSPAALGVGAELTGEVNNEVNQTSGTSP